MSYKVNGQVQRYILGCCESAEACVLLQGSAIQQLCAPFGMQSIGVSTASFRRYMPLGVTSTCVDGLWAALHLKFQ